MTDPVCINHIIEKARRSPAAVGLALLGLVTLALLSWGCGSAENPAATATQSAGAGLTTKTIPTTPADTYPAATSVSVPDEPLSDVTPTMAATGPVEVVIGDAQPTTVQHGAPVKFIIKTRGAAASATMEIQGLAMSLCPLTDKTTEGDLTVWSATVAAPQTPGNYRFYPTATDTGGNRITPPGVSAWSGYLTVT